MFTCCLKDQLARAKVAINDKQTILRRTIYARKFNVGIIQYLPLAMKQHRRDLLGVAKSFHSKGKKI